jgi:hypothetical protein
MLEIQKNPNVKKSLGYNVSPYIFFLVFLGGLSRKPVSLVQKISNINMELEMGGSKAQKIANINMELELDANKRQISDSLYVIEADKKSPDATITRRMHIQDEEGEHSLHMVVVVEDFRVAFYLNIFVLGIVGALLTKFFTEEDKDIILLQVYGASSLCSVFDYPPSTYVLPSLWCFALISGIMYSVASIFRVWVSYLEMKLSRREAVLLIIVHVYVALSVIFFSTIFAVQPDPEEPITMVIHSIPYMNLKLMFCVLQGAVVYFGIKVSWVELNFPRWFYSGSIIHLGLLTFAQISIIVNMSNALGNMGARLEGKGLWWSVQGKASKLVGNILGTYGGFFLQAIVPFAQALYICTRGTNSHALIIVVDDNRESAFNEVKRQEVILDGNL